MNNNIAATIQGKTFHYQGSLTINHISEYRETVLWMIRNDPDYLFLTEKAMLDIFGLQTYYMQRTCLGMLVVVLPTLPENTLIIGKFLLREEDPFQALSDQCENTKQDDYKGLD